jgi:GT2 family glycosyltransferase
MISISVVSHAQGNLVEALLKDLSKIAQETPIEILLTKNLPEKTPAIDSQSQLGLRVIENLETQGFGHNHNVAFSIAKGDYFCVLNPDIRLSMNPFPELLAALEDHHNAIVAPQILAPAGQVEDSVRSFPTPWGLVKRLMGMSNDSPLSADAIQPIPVDWAAGMFLLMRSTQYAALGGFDKRFFLYCEDVDLSARAWKSGRRVLLCPQAKAVHDAQRASHRNLKYFRWHFASYARYFSKHFLMSPRLARLRVDQHI